MGLDMYAMTTSETVNEVVDFDAEVSWANQVHYWRKHPNLHGWMESLYRKKGGKAESFNTVNVMLDEADLDRLEADIRAGTLPKTEGFFFGISDGTETEDDLAFIKRARDVMRNGQQVFYTSWW